jgi:hypothetical protein
MRPTHYFHYIKLPGRSSKYSAWFSGDPLGADNSLAVLVDGERIDRAGRSYPLTESERSALIKGPWSALGNYGAFKTE